MIRKVTIGAVAVIFIGFIVYGILELRKGNIQQADIVQAVPTDAALIINANDLSRFIRDEMSRNKIWNELGTVDGIGAFQRTLGKLDSMLRIDEEMQKLYKGSDISLSLHRSGKNRVEYILYYTLENTGTEKQMLRFIQDKVSYEATLTPRKYDEIRIYDVVFPGNKGKNNFSFTFSRGLFILSPSSILLEASIRQLSQSQSVMDETGFKEVAETAGRNVEGNLYLDYKTIPGFVSHLFNERYTEKVTNFVHFADWSEMDVNIRHDALLLNGFTHSSAVSDDFLNIILKHQPQRLDIEGIIPENVSAFLALGLDDFPGYKKDYLEHLEIHGNGRSYLRELRSLNEKYKMDLDKLLLPVFDRQVALVLTDIRNFGWDENAYVVCNTKSQSLAIEKLKELMTIVCEKDGISLASLIVQQKVMGDVPFTFYQLPVSYLPMKLFGKMFEGINSKYCTFFDNYLIFGNSIQSLSKYIHANQIGNNLSSDLEYHQFSEYLASRSNFYFYLNFPGSTRLMERYLRQDLVKKIMEEKDHLFKFQAFAYQITSENALAYNNIIIKYTPDMRDEAQTIWESRLESRVVIKPKFVVNHYTGEKEIFVQDAMHNVYLLNNSGRILWKQKIDGQILSDIYQIDIYKNGKLQLLFNTSEQLHLLDRNGNYVERYPVKLRSPATNGLALFDYEQSKDYRIFLAAEDKGVYLYDKEGNILKGWSFGKTEGRVTMPLRHFRVGNRDYIVFADHFTCYILNRRGETRVTVKKHFPVSQNARFIMDSNTPGIKPRLALTDSSGQVKFIYFDGSVESVEIDRFTGDHFFDYNDLNGDGRKEFIFADKGELMVYKHDGSRGFSYDTRAEISYAPVVYQFSNGNKKIGMVTSDNNKLYLINSDGSLYKGFPLPGSTPFSVGVIDRSTSKFNLIVGSGDNFLYNYSVQ
jgi:hypothetical protein